MCGMVVQTMIGLTIYCRMLPPMTLGMNSVRLRAARIGHWTVQNKALFASKDAWRTYTVGPNFSVLPRASSLRILICSSNDFWSFDFLWGGRESRELLWMLVHCRLLQCNSNLFYSSAIGRDYQWGPIGKQFPELQLYSKYMKRDVMHLIPGRESAYPISLFSKCLSISLSSLNICDRSLNGPLGISPSLCFDVCLLYFWMGGKITSKRAQRRTNPHCQPPVRHDFFYFVCKK